MKTKSRAEEIPYTQVPSGGVFTREEGGHAYISFDFMAFDEDGNGGCGYNAVDLIDGDLVYVDEDEFVQYYPDAFLTL